MSQVIKGKLVQGEEFTFPDSSMEILPEKITLSTPVNGKQGIQILIPSSSAAICSLDSNDFETEWFQMKAIPIEYNTGDGIEQGGDMVILTDKKPSYAIKKAPFKVFDCLIPKKNGIIESTDNLVAIYITFTPKPDIKAGKYFAKLKVSFEDTEYNLEIEIRVYNVVIPNEKFQVTNWFSLSAISRFHNVKQGSPEFMEVLGNYIDLMRRVRQTCFFLELDKTCLKSRKPYVFDFSHLKDIISLFFEKGMQYIELGSFLSRGYKDNGMPDMYTDTFRCAFAPEIDLETLEGYEITVLYAKSLGKFLKENGWIDKVMIHIHDEPDIHTGTNSKEVLVARKRQYYQTASIIRKYIPEVRIIEAVATSEFKGGIDVWVPTTSSYEKEKENFEKLIDLGEEVWNYVCCSPQGHWLNRFLDFALIKNRLLFWGFSKNRLSGFLHWGFNQFPEGMNPFEATSCPNPTGIGTNFPCGDAFIAYPWSGKDALPSMRLEAQRKGAEDVELLSILRQKDINKYNELVSKLFTSNEVYCDDVETFEKVYEELLKAISEV